MKGSDSWLSVMSDFSLQFDALKKGDIGADTIIRKLDILLAEHNNLDDKSLLELKYSIFSANLPGELTRQLLNKVSEQKTNIIQENLPSPSPDENSSPNEHDEGQHQTHSSSLLKNLTYWDESKQTKPIKAGQIIRSTYCLDYKIGSGGMGEVWKAIDLIQDAGEAKDKYVAIKFINHEIRRHPFALKALIREFARYKKLIHPNIVKAYELNRDDNEIFITMEYLEGEPLKEFIRQHPRGVPLNKAQPIIKGMCDALEHSHNEGIVHLDVKPGNIFYNPATQVCKVIDFGIARLSSLQERDNTRFDPGSLGAMTTSYASGEMLMGAEPDPKDDVYGLACVIYELLSGQHPFHKNLALKAEREKLQPKQIPGLKKDEFQALVHGLSFHRENRTPSAKQLYSELFVPQKQSGQKNTRKLIIGSITVLAIIFIPLIAYKAYNSWNIYSVNTAIQQKIKSGMEGFISLSVDEQKELLNNPAQRLAIVEYATTHNNSANDALSVLEQFDPTVQQLLFTTRKVREYLITFYSNEINQAIKEDDFQLAEQLVQRILQHYPDSMQLIQQSKSIKPKKETRLATIEKSYLQCLEDQSNNLTELFPCLQETRAIISKIDPNNDLLTAPKLSARYSKETSAAINNNKLPLAETLLANWHSLEKNQINQRVKLEQKLATAIKIDDLIRQFNENNNLEPVKDKTAANNHLKVLQELKDKLAQSTQTQSSSSGEQSIENKATSNTADLAALLDKAEKQLETKQLMKPAGDNAWQTYQEVLILDPENKQALAGLKKITKTYTEWAREEQNKGNFQEAKYLFNKALEVSPGNQEALSGRARLDTIIQASQQPALEQSQVPKSATDTSEITKLLNKAEQQFAKKQLITPVEDSAWQSYKKILDIDSDNEQALAGIDKITKTYILWATVEAKKDNFKQAKLLFNKALQVSPNNKEAISGLAMLDKSKPSSPVSDQVNEPVPNTPEIAELLKKAERQLARKQLMTPVKNSAWQTYQDILTLSPDNEQALAGIDKITKTYIAWAREEQGKGNFQEAKYLFNKALEASPGDKDALMGLAMLNQSHPALQEQPTPASDTPIVKQSNQENTEVADLLNKAEQQRANNQLTTPVEDNAWQTYKQVLILEPGNELALAGIKKITETYVLLGREEMEKGNFKHAAHLFNKALEISPGNQDALSGLAWLNEVP